ncbi:MAG: hypothetical protein AAF357_04115 [Verrucomicrobiota bacterium]
MYKSYHLIIFLFMSVPLLFYMPVYFVKHQSLRKQLILNKIRRIKFIEQKLKIDNQRVIRLSEIERIDQGYFSKP